MDIVNFAMRYSPFWGIPLIIIFAELAYLSWRRGHRKEPLFFLLLTLLCGLVLTYYYWAGGPVGATQNLQKKVDSYRTL